MIEGLREITKAAINLPPRTQDNLHKKSIAYLSIRQVLTLNLDTIDFGECFPGSVHERKISVTLKEPQDSPKIITLTILCEDETLSMLPQYIFGVRKENTYEYFDQFKFRAAQKGIYSFVVGVKTPNLKDYNVGAKLVVQMEGVDGAICVGLSQICRIPFVTCNKLLADEEGVRMIKIGVVKNKSKKQTKIAFRCPENMNFTLLTELLGGEGNSNNEIEVKPKVLQTGGKGIFVLTFVTNSPSNLQQQWLCIRKVLVLRIKDTNFHYPFPVEATFYPSNRRESQPSMD